jgi:hypothetical protein
MEHIIRNKFKDRPKGLKLFGYILAGISIAVLFAFLFGYFAMLLWNWLMPEIFGLTTISYWQAVGLIVLARLIFGGFGHGGNGSKKHKKHWAKECCDDEKTKKWKYYHDYWKEEGEDQFNEYVERKQKGSLSQQSDA